MKTALTKKQRKTLDYITTFIEQKGYSPSYREIANGLKLNSVATVAQHIDTLVEKGFLEKGANSARSLVPVEEVEAFLNRIFKKIEGLFNTLVDLNHWMTNDPEGKYPKYSLNVYGKKPILKIKSLLYKKNTVE